MTGFFRYDKEQLEQQHETMYTRYYWSKKNWLFALHLIFWIFPPPTFFLLSWRAAAEFCLCHWLPWHCADYHDKRRHIKNSPLILDRLLKIITKQTNNTMGPNIYNASIESLTLDLSHLLKKKICRCAFKSVTNSGILLKVRILFKNIFFISWRLGILSHTFKSTTISSTNSLAFREMQSRSIQRESIIVELSTYCRYSNPNPYSLY